MAFTHDLVFNELNQIHDNTSLLHSTCKSETAFRKEWNRKALQLFTGDNLFECFFFSFIYVFRCSGERGLAVQPIKGRHWRRDDAPQCEWRQSIDTSTPASYILKTLYNLLIPMIDYRAYLYCAAAIEPFTSAISIYVATLLVSLVEHVIWEGGVGSLSLTSPRW